MTWLDLYNYLNKQANDVDNFGKFPWQNNVEVFDFETLQYYQTDFIQMPDNKISLSIDTYIKNNQETVNGSGN